MALRTRRGYCLRLSGLTSARIRAAEKARTVDAPGQKLRGWASRVRVNDEMRTGCPKRGRLVVVARLRLVPRADVHVRGAALSDRDHRGRVCVAHDDERGGEQARKMPRSLCEGLVVV